MFCILFFVSLVTSRFLACAPGFFGFDCSGICDCPKNCICGDGVNGDGKCICSIEYKYFPNSTLTTEANTLESLSEHIDSTFINELPGDKITDNYVRSVFNSFYSIVKPFGFVSTPYLIHANQRVAQLLDLDAKELNRNEFIQLFCGNILLAGSIPIAQCYGGHQFGNWAGQLGDGRANIIFSILNKRGEHWEVQLKGAGKTPYSRHGDGRAVMRSSIREYLCSEFMFSVGIPTTRALSIIGSEDQVFRDQFYNGNGKNEKAAVVARLSESFIRFGTFEIFYYRKDFENIKKLADYLIKYHVQSASSYYQLFEFIVNKTAITIAMWQSFGFAHGVLNTDNMSILGVTIDYGPFGFLDTYNPEFVPNFSDDESRYAFNKQPDVGYFNLQKLSIALSPILPLEESEKILATYHQKFQQNFLQKMGEKLGIKAKTFDSKLIDDLLSLLKEAKVDYTRFFRELSSMFANEKCNLANLLPMFSNYEKKLHKWLSSYEERLEVEEESIIEREKKMKKVNPIYIPRNYLLQKAIEHAENGDFSEISNLYEVLTNPFIYAGEKYSEPPPKWAKEIIVSCSS